jgi:hypothetical protein
VLVTGAATFTIQRRGDARFGDARFAVLAIKPGDARNAVDGSGVVEGGVGGPFRRTRKPSWRPDWEKFAAKTEQR